MKAKRTKPHEMKDIEKATDISEQSVFTWEVRRDQEAPLGPPLPPPGALVPRVVSVYTDAVQSMDHGCCGHDQLGSSLLPSDPHGQGRAGQGRLAKHSFVHLFVFMHWPRYRYHCRGG